MMTGAEFGDLEMDEKIVVMDHVGFAWTSAECLREKIRLITCDQPGEKKL
jgi:hypothetical protein